MTMTRKKDNSLTEGKESISSDLPAVEGQESPVGIEADAYELLGKGLPPGEIANELRLTQSELKKLLRGKLQ
jgi:hypothetical protein